MLRELSAGISRKNLDGAVYLIEHIESRSSWKSYIDILSFVAKSVKQLGRVCSPQISGAAITCGRNRRSNALFRNP